MPRNRRPAFDEWRSQLDAICRDEAGTQLDGLELHADDAGMRDHWRSGASPRQYFDQVIMMVGADDESADDAFDARYEI